jgi:redox-sensitive bicupin YhaK (pirin superfamily)
MIDKRSFDSLGKFDADWLAARYHFSFAGYRDPERVQWGALRVWNDDTIQPKTGFPPHPHSDMEIITYVRTGAITHQDSMGNRGRTEAGDVQVMSAGSGVTHAEYNLEDDATTIYQIWILPKQHGGAPPLGAGPVATDAPGGALLGRGEVSEGRPCGRARHAGVGLRGRSERRRAADPAGRARPRGDAEAGTKRRV